MKSSHRMGTSTRARTASRSAREPPKQRRSVRTLIAEPPPSRVLLHQRSRARISARLPLPGLLRFASAMMDTLGAWNAGRGSIAVGYACRTRTQLRQRCSGFVLFKVLTSRGELRSASPPCACAPPAKQSNAPLKHGLGLDHFEGRSWPGWHHHVTLVTAAHAFLTEQRLAPKAPDRTHPLPDPRRPPGHPAQVLYGR